MKKHTLALLLILCASTAEAKILKFNDLETFREVKSFYQRLEATKQPQSEIYGTYGVALLDEVNRDVNRQIRYLAESADGIQWQTPAETKKLGTGDCEDYAAAKWKVLLDNGIPETDMYFFYGTHKAINRQHVELMVYLNGNTYYLDNDDEDITVSRINPEFLTYMLNRWGVTVYNPYKE